MRFSLPGIYARASDIRQGMVSQLNVRTVKRHKNSDVHSRFKVGSPLMAEGEPDAWLAAMNECTSELSDLDESQLEGAIFEGKETCMAPAPWPAPHE